MNYARHETTLEEREKAAKEIYQIYLDFGPAFEERCNYDIEYLMCLSNKDLFRLKATMERRQRNFLTIAQYLEIQEDNYKKNLLSTNTNEDLESAAQKIREYYRKLAEAKKHGETYRLDWNDREQILDLVSDIPLSSVSTSTQEAPLYPDKPEEFLSDEELEYAYGPMNVTSINNAHQSNIMCMRYEA